MSALDKEQNNAIENEKGKKTDFENDTNAARANENLKASKKSLWTFDFIGFCIARFCSSAVFSLLTTAMAFYVANGLHESSAVAGLITGIYVIAALPSRLWAGVYTERYGEKNLLRVASLVFLICCALYMVITNIVLLFIVRAIHGLSFGLLANCLSSGVAKQIPTERLGEGMGYYALGSTFAYAVGPYLGISLTQTGNFFIMFGACSASAAIMFIVSFLIRGTGISGDESYDVHANGEKWYANIIEKDVVPISVMSMILGICYTAIASYLSMYSQGTGFEAYASYYFLLYSVIMLVSRPAMGKLLDKRGEKYAIFPLFVVGAGSLFVIAFAQGPILMFASSVLLAFGYGALFTNMQTSIIIGKPKEKFGVCTATFFLFADIGSGVGPMVWGSMLTFTGYFEMYILAGIIMVAMFVAFPFVSKSFRKDKANM